MQSRWRFVPSLATGSGPLGQCGDDATNSSTPRPGETTTYDEARKAIRDAEGLLQAAQQLLPTLSIF